MRQTVMNKFPILYSFRRCPWAMRARIAMHYAGVQCEIREVKLREKPAAFLAIAPKATVPTLVLPDGKIIDESMDIIDFALKHHDPDNWGDANMSEVDCLVSIAEGDFVKAVQRYKYHERFSEQSVEENRKLCEELLITDLEQRLGKHKFLLANKPSIADVAIFPLIRQFAAVDDTWFQTTPYSNTRVWLNSWMQSPHYIGAMKKYAPWKEGNLAEMFL